MAADRMASNLVAIVPFDGREIELEYEWINAARRDAPLVAFLHEGLGSVEMWRDFPRELCAAGEYRGFVYSRYGYGQSTARPKEERWTPAYLERQAHGVLPALLHVVGAADTRLWLFGHSDGATIALVYAAAFPEGVSGVIAMAPHVFLEEVARVGIAATRQRYESAGFKERLARYHADPDSAFWGWHDAWMDPSFTDWNIERMLSSIRCPVLAIQGFGDEYGSMGQLDAIARAVPTAELLKLENCGHSPHRDLPEVVVQATVGFIGRHRPFQSPARRD
jgi:pimeloyl-ACP methyl ester carboxylesterase